MWQPKISNCLIWALYQVARHGGGIKAYRSHYGWWPHFCWEAPDGETWEYVPPVRVRLTGWRQVLPVRIMLFRGTVRLVDEVQKIINRG